jgi:hypothetical protein
MVRVDGVGGASRPNGRYQVQRDGVQQLFLQRGAGVDPTMFAVPEPEPEPVPVPQIADGVEGESFMRVHWVAVPKELRARRVNREWRCPRRGGAGGGGGRQ